MSRATGPYAPARGASRRRFGTVSLGLNLGSFAFLHVVVQLRIHARRLVRAILGEMTLLLADSARVVRRKRAVLREVPSLAASVALVVRLRRSVIRQRARRGPVTLLTAAVAHVIRSRDATLSPRRVVPSSAAARANLSTLSREVSKASAIPARIIPRSRTARSTERDRSDRRRAVPRVMSQPPASRASVARSRAAAAAHARAHRPRIRQRALRRPVSNLTASITSIRASSRRRARALTRVVPEFAAISARVPVRGTARVRGVARATARAVTGVIDPLTHGFTRVRNGRRPRDDERGARDPIAIEPPIARARGTGTLS